MTNKLQDIAEDFIRMHRFPRDGNKNPEHQSFVIREADLRDFLAQFVLCEREPVAHAVVAPDGNIRMWHMSQFEATPLHAPAKGLPEASDTQEQTR